MTNSNNVKAVVARELVSALRRAEDVAKRATPPHRFEFRINGANVHATLSNAGLLVDVYYVSLRQIGIMRRVTVICSKEVSRNKWSFKVLIDNSQVQMFEASDLSLAEFRTRFKQLLLAIQMLPAEVIK
jgi:hypothetical protein